MTVASKAAGRPWLASAPVSECTARSDDKAGVEARAGRHIVIASANIHGFIVLTIAQSGPFFFTYRDLSALFSKFIGPFPSPDPL
jgi:hypothetical protein